MYTTNNTVNNELKQLEANTLNTFQNRKVSSLAPSLHSTDVQNLHMPLPVMAHMAAGQVLLQ
jgi:hypothetical protein